MKVARIYVQFVGIQFTLQNDSADAIEADSNQIREFALNPVCGADVALVSCYIEI